MKLENINKDKFKFKDKAEEIEFYKSILVIDVLCELAEEAVKKRIWQSNKKKSIAKFKKALTDGLKLLKWIIYRELFEEEKFNKRRLPDEAVEEIIKIVYVATKLNVYGMEQSNLLELEEIKRSLGYVLVLRDEKAMKEGGVTREKVLESFKKRRAIV